ncbi:MAG: hypothetical protein WB524_18715 [Acidobacteriaceae bacterium]
MANEPKLPTGQIVKWLDKDHPVVYANLMGFSLTPFDIALMFGQIGESTPEQINGIPQCKVLLSPEQVSNLLKLLSIALDTYVESQGQLRTSGAVNLEAIRHQMEKAKIIPGAE